MKETTKHKIDFVLIVVIFTITGLTTAYLSGTILNLLGEEPWTLIYIAGYLIFIFPLYQGLLLFFALVFGKFNFFYIWQKKLFKKLYDVLK